MAADSYYTRLGYDAFSGMIGDEIQGYYANTSNSLTPITFTRYSMPTSYITSTNMSSVSSQAPENSYMIWFYASVPADISQGNFPYPYFTFDFNLHFSNVSYFGCMCGTEVNSWYSSYSHNQVSQTWYMNAGSSSAGVVPLPARSNDSSLAGYFATSAGVEYGGIWFEYEGNATDIYITSFTCSCVYSNNGLYWVGISCPVLSPDYVFEGVETPPSPPSGGGTASGSGSASGTITTDVSGNQSIDLDIDLELPQQDLTESGPLSWIADKFSDLLLGIKNLFIPSHEDLEDFFDDAETIIFDKIDPLATTVIHITDCFDSIRGSEADTHIRISPVTFPIGDNTDFTLDLNPTSSGVPLVPNISGNNVTNGLLHTCKYIINIVCTLAFVNMCRRKIDLILNPNAETIIEYY